MKYTDENPEKAHASRLAIAREVGIDPAQTIDISVEWTGDKQDLVAVRWEGYAEMPLARLRELLKEAEGEA